MAALAVAAFMCAPAVAHAQHPFAHFTPSASEAAPPTLESGEPICFYCAHDATVPISFPPGLFGGIGTPGRYWELRSDTAVDSDRPTRIFAQRFSVARALDLRPGFALIVGTTFGLDADLGTGDTTVQGPIFSLGLRARTLCDRYSLEAGVRLIPPFEAYGDGTPAASRLALGASITSATADDARWLSFADFGAQLYAAFRARTDPFGGTETSAYLGLSFALATSLWPLKVRTWLGPQEGVVGNLELEAFLGLHRMFDVDLNVQLGLHGEASLTGLWPAGVTFPLDGVAFVGWSPERWFAARIFFGTGGAPSSGAEPFRFIYGLRLQFFLP